VGWYDFRKFLFESSSELVGPYYYYIYWFSFLYLYYLSYIDYSPVCSNYHLSYFTSRTFFNHNHAINSITTIIPNSNQTPHQYNLLGRVRELDLLTKTADAQILSRLEANGITLATLEAALPLADKLGLAEVAGNNQQLLINFVAPLLVEPAPYLLPAIGSALEVGPAAFFGAAAAVGGLEVLFLVQDVRIPFVGLEAGIYVGALLVPVTAVLFGLGAGLTISNSNKNA